MIYEKLAQIQAQLKVSKGQYNSFGGFAYRSCEDILEAVKPLLKAHGCALTIGDELKAEGGRYYIKAVACLTDCEDGSRVENTAFAREEEAKKGMDAAQLTGATSSYARKYALNGLFCIDDCKDLDANEVKQMEQTAEMTEKERRELGKKIIGKDKLDAIEAEMKRTGVKPLQITSLYKIGNLQEMNLEQWMECMKKLEQTPDRKKKDLGL